MPSKDITLTKTGFINSSGTKTIGFDWRANSNRNPITKEYTISSAESGVMILNKLVVTQDGASLKHTASGSTSKTAAEYGSGETITFDGTANGRYIKFSSGTISSFVGFSFQENSTGEYVSKSPGNTWIAVGSFGETYHYKVICPVPVNWGSGATAVITVSVSDSNDANASSIDITYELTNAIAPPAVTTANIYAVYKSPRTGGGEQVNGKIGSYIDNVNDDKSYTISTSYSSSYTYSLMDTLTGNVNNTIKFGVSASASGVVMQSPFTIYASRANVSETYITEGTFISSSREVGTLANNSWNYDNLMYTIPFSTIWAQLSLDEGDEINLYVLIGADTAHGPSVSTSSSDTYAEIEYNDSTGVYGDEIGFEALINGAATSSTYTITAKLYLTPSSQAESRFTLVNNGVLYSASNQTIAANGTYTIDRSIAHGALQTIHNYITITNNPSATDSEILEEIYSLVSEVKIQLTIHDENTVIPYADVVHNISLYRQH